MNLYRLTERIDPDDPSKTRDHYVLAASWDAAIDLWRLQGDNGDKGGVIAHVTWCAQDVIVQGCGGEPQGGGE